ncbi:endonuclease/exonuclease/phosphatase family protein [Rothia sp. HMSC061E04]|uniref:endonuclease/exonuclease/phosphatase family protein n=1 Tax=Rothia sp. HMSC061E04 TaxID=1739431 RepID=UPI0008A369FE|nr:endonuclease/exonuclease/phosphatase family protein [Rothia sp. HMSC061E04]OFQ61872.1 endonuclease [Rothia sp. HMSC061E04]
MRFLTLNTHSWCEIHQIAKIRALAKFIIEQQVDVIALQEVNQLTSTPVVEHPLHFRGGAGIPVREDNYALLLVRALEALGARYEWTLTETHLGWERYDECVAVLSRLPIRGIKPINMSPDYTYFQVQRRAAQATLIETETGTFWCATTHMSWWDFDGEPLFAQEYAHLSQELAECARTAPVLLGGDFNSAAHLSNEGYALVTSSGMVDTRSLAEHTDGENTVHREIAGWEGSTDAKRIDFVFADRLVDVVSHAVVFRDNSPEAISDHSGLLLEIDPASWAPQSVLTPLTTQH